MSVTVLCGIVISVRDGTAGHLAYAKRTRLVAYVRVGTAWPLASAKRAIAQRTSQSATLHGVRRLGFLCSDMLLQGGTSLGDVPVLYPACEHSHVHLLAQPCATLSLLQPVLQEFFLLGPGAMSNDVCSN